MTFPQVYQLFGYWREFPPEQEMLAMFARIYTTWRPAEVIDTMAVSPEAAQMKSLEQRWAAGIPNVKQLFEAGGAAFAKFEAVGAPRAVQ